MSPIVAGRIRSAALAGNLIGDPTERELLVYLPPSYEDAGSTRYPVVYLLHGFGERAHHWIIGPWINQGWWQQPIHEVLDDLVAAGGPEVIVVMPDGWSRYGCSQWVASPVNGDFESYVTDEIVGTIDAHYRTAAEPAGRCVCGLSSGGFGAWHLATRRPDVFGFASMLSADTLFDVTHLAWVYRAYEAALPGPPSGPIPGNWDSWLTYGLASCYSPNPDAPFFVDLPLDHPGGRLRGDVWERWLAYDPCVNVSARSAAVRRLHGIRLDVGRRDEYGFLWGHRSLAASLREIGVEPREVEHDGTHVSHLMQSVAETVRWFAGDG